MQKANIYSLFSSYMSNKVVFGLREQTTVNLPVSKGEVKMYKFLTVAETREITAKYPHAADATHIDAQDANVEMLLKLIVSWNFTDENGVDLPVSGDILKQFVAPDMEALGNVVAEAMTKKKS